MLNAAKFTAAEVISLDAFCHLLRSPMLAEECSVVSGCSHLVVDLNQPLSETSHRTRQGEIIWQPNTVVVGLCDETVAELADSTQALLPFIDLIADSKTADYLLDAALNNIVSHPMASTALVQVLRQSLTVSIEQALILESLTYSSLQHGAEFMDWLNDGAAPKPQAQAQAQGIEPVVLCERQDAHLTVTLNRPAKHNAFSATMRDGLTDALLLASADTSIKRVTLKGAGPSFCAGGDLDEFGEARNAAVAHLTRTTRSPGR